MYTCLAKHPCLCVRTTGKAEPGDKSKSSDGVSVKLLVYFVNECRRDVILPERMLSHTQTNFPTYYLQPNQFQALGQLLAFSGFIGALVVFITRRTMKRQQV